ncbi:MAG: ABC transporter ATP-binding protein [Actinomycetota bacterium]|nr:ABC transporter ATP-binding protein [Actinomycetota bacterium]
MDVRIGGVAVELGGWRACDDVTIDVPSGSFTVLVGPNGAGKSTLLRCIYRALRPAAGAVLVGGDDVWALAGRDAGRRVAAVVQEGAAGFDLTVRELVSLGRLPHRRSWERLRDDDRAVVDDALGRVGLDPMADRAVTTLSGGERQRALIARALAQQASVLVLDEPTNHLDIRHQLETLELVRDLEITTIAALHDLALADRYADRVVVLDRGRVVTDGPPAAALDRHTIAEVFGLHAEVVEAEAGERTLVLRLPPAVSAPSAPPGVNGERRGAADPS